MNYNETVEKVKFQNTIYIVNELALSVILDVYASLLDNKTFDIRSAVAATTGRKK